jgi:cytochrome c oxidase assembly protein subunit 15
MKLSVRRLIVFNILLALVVITLGALTRLLDAGLGCPDWPVCYGNIIPDAKAAEGFNLWAFDEGKAWMEMIHRYLASFLGLMILIQAVIIWPRYLGAVRYLSVFLCGWVVLQGLFGMWTVTLRLWPPVVSAHLLGGAITIGALFLMWRVLTSHREPNWTSPWAVFALVVFLQMALGAWTSSQYAGLACPDFPTCQGNWWVEIDSRILHAPKVKGDEYLGGILGNHERMAIQWTHRLGALLVLAMFLYLVFKSSSFKHNPKNNRVITFCFLFLVTQIALGIANAIYLLPLSLALLHNTVAMLLWLSVINGLTLYEKDTEVEITEQELLA